MIDAGNPNFSTNTVTVGVIVSECHSHDLFGRGKFFLGPKYGGSVTESDVSL